MKRRRGAKTDPSQGAIDRVARECLALRVRLLNRVVTHIYDDSLRPLGIKISQMNILMVVAKAGAMTPGLVSKLLHMEKSTLSRNLERIRKHCWLEVRPGEGGRPHRLMITAKGKKLLLEGFPLWEQAQAKARALLGQRGADSLYRAGNTVWRRAGREKTVAGKTRSRRGRSV